MTAAEPSHHAPTTLALMYHAIDDGEVVDGEDPHYTVTTKHFEAHLDTLAAHGVDVTSAHDWIESPRPAVLMTFDDGHVSNHRFALPTLAKRGMRADFFVNPARVGTSGMASWNDLREMSDAGMSIQSHGWDHRYFTALTPDELREDLTRSRKAIEDKLGKPVTLLAPPGGRMHADLPDVARECGYRHVLSSEPGRIRRPRTLLPRMAVTSSLDTPTLEGWLAGRGIARARVRYGVLAIAKRALGDARYERVRSRLLDRGGRHA